MIGTYASEYGSQSCSVCDEGWMTAGDGHAACTVKLRSTDLSKEYAIIVSLAVLLNGTSLDEISQARAGLSSGVNASGVAVLELSIRADLAGVFNISMADVSVTDVTAVGHRRLQVSILSTVKVDECVNATQEQCEAAFHVAASEADTTINKIATDPDSYLQRTIQATNSQPQVSRAGVFDRRMYVLRFQKALTFVSTAQMSSRLKAQYNCSLKALLALSTGTH